MKKSRRGRHEGSVAKRKDGRWEARISLGVDRDGKRKYVSVYGATKQEALDRLQAKMNKLGRGGGDRSEIDAYEYAAAWVEEARDRLKPITIRRYFDHLKHIRRHLPRTSVSAIGVEHLRRMLAAMDAAGLTASIRKRCYVLLRTTLQTAHEEGLREAPPRLKTPRPKAKESRSLSRDEAERLLTACREDVDIRDIVLFLLDSGCRIAEAMAVMWDDYNPVEGVLRIRRSLDHESGREQKPKTAKSVRTLLLGKRCREMLDRRKGEMRAGKLVFPNARGSFFSYQNLRKRFKPLAAEAGLAEIGFHSLRHTNASLLIEAGVSAKIVSERLGHADIAITLDTYTHLLDEAQRIAVDTLDRLFGSTGKPIIENEK